MSVPAVRHGQLFIDVQKGDETYFAIPFQRDATILTLMNALKTMGIFKTREHVLSRNGKVLNDLATPLSWYKCKKNLVIVIQRKPGVLNSSLADSPLMKRRNQLLATKISSQL